MSEIRRLVKHSTIYSLGHVLNRAAAFLLLPLYTRHMSVAEYGFLELLYSVKVVAASLLSMGLAHATLRFYFEYQEERDRRRVVGTTLAALWLLAVPAVAALWMGSPWLAKTVLGEAGYALELNLLFSLMLLEMSTEVGLAYLRAREYSKLFVGVCTMQLFMQVAVSIYAVGVLGMGVRGVLFGNLAAAAAGWTVLMSVVLRECGLSFDRAKLAQVLRYSAPFVLSSICAVIVNNADRFLLKTYASMADLGLYSLAIKFGILMQVLLLEPFHQSFGAFRFSIMNHPDNRQILGRILKFAAFGLLFLGLAISLFAEPGLRLLAAPEYHAAHTLVPVIVLGYTISGLTYFFQTGILYQKRTSYIFYITLVSGLTALAGNFLLIPRFEAAGAAASVVLRSVVTIAVTYAISNRLYPIVHRRWELVKMYAAGALLYAASRLLPSNPLSFSIASRNLVWLCFPVLVVLFGCVTRQELSELGGWMSPAVGRLRGLARGEQS